MIYFLNVALVVVTSLVVLGGFLKGAKKTQINFLINLLLIGMVIAVFAIADWKHGVLAIVIAFPSAVVTRLIAARIASRLFRMPSGTSGGSYVGLPPRPLRKIYSKKLQTVGLTKKLLRMMFFVGFLAFRLEKTR